MYYLARNKEVVSEASRYLDPSRGVLIGHSTYTDFTTVGSFPSAVLGKEVFVGIKEYKRSKSNKVRLKHRAPLELATITAIAEHIPAIRDDLPVFYALLRGTKGKPIGILMEDFSEGGRLFVGSPIIFPTEIVTLLGQDVLNNDYVHNMAFNVEGKNKYGDFYPIFRDYIKEGVVLARFPMRQAIGQVRRNMWQHTIRLGRDL